MKRQGFTLLELLIVTVVVVTLMGIVFRLAGTGGTQRAQAKTIERLQRLENCLSGYYAAYGSYPPVPLQGRSRDIYQQVNDYGVQAGGSKQFTISPSDTTNDKSETWKQIDAAMKAQPVAVTFPLNSDDPTVQKWLTSYNNLNSKSYKLINNVGGYNIDASEWQDITVFKFGLLSFILPRYDFMLEGDEEFYDDEAHPNSQWAVNNRRPFLLDGTRKTWRDIQKATSSSRYYNYTASGNEAQTKAMISYLPSQAACARWMPNLEKIIKGGGEYYGINTAEPDEVSTALVPIEQRPSSGTGGNTSNAQVVESMTVEDGWKHDFYYYSEPPYQSYRLWSAGPNGRTYPPWMDPPSADEKIVGEWIADDIVHMSH